MVERAQLAGSRMTMPPDVWGSGVFGGASEALGGWSAVHCLFQVLVGGGGGESDPCLGFVAGRVQGKKWSSVIDRLTTISSSPWYVSASEELTDSVVACSAG